MKKHYFKSLLTTILLLCSAVLNAQDISVQYTGFEYQGIYYKFTGGSTVAVGEIYKSGDIEIPEIVLCDLDFMEPYYTVTSIGDRAFENETGVTSVKIPNTITSIGEWAFYNCTSLTSITIPNSVTNIAYGAFYGCTGIKEVVIEDGTTELYLVESNSGYAEGRGPWHYGTFYYCPLESLYLGRNVSYPLPELWGNSPFSLQETLTSVTIGQNVTSIGKRLFERCTNLANITIPNSIKTIDDEAFEGCNILAEVIIPSSVSRIGNYAFSDCISLPSIAIPNSVTEIGEYAFFCCASLNSATIGNGVTSIRRCAFAGCRSLASISIPNNVTTIEYQAFSSCEALTSVTIGNGVTSMGEHAFAGNNNLSAVYISDLSAWCKIDFYDNESTPLLYAHNLYVNGELLTDLVIPSDVTEIVNHAFQGCTSITSVTIPAGITRVGVAAFEWCSNLTGELVIPNSVKRIEGWAFSETKLTGIKWSNGLTYIGQCAFNRCYELAGEGLVIPEGVESIDGDAFCACYNLTGELVIPNSVKTIGVGAFNGCSGFTSVRMGSGVQTIGNDAFGWMGWKAKDVYITDLSAWCKIDFNGSNPLNGGANLHLNGELLTDLVIPDDITEIKPHAFYNCKSIKTVDLGNVTSIGYEAFSYCDNLIGELVIPNSVTNIGYSVFYGCRNLAGVSIGDGVTVVSNAAFYDCRNLSQVTLGKNIETIEMYNFDRWAVSSVTFNMNTVKDWFRDFPEITEVHFGDNVQTITGGAFAHCDIDSVHIPAGVTSIEDYAFSWNQHLRKVTVAPENSVYHIDEDHHVMMETATDKVALAYQGATIPPYATAIGNGAFNGLLGITKLTIPESIESIGEWAFDGCSDLKKVINYSGLLLTKGSTDHGYVAYYADEVINITDIIDGYVFLTVEDVNYLMDYTGEATTLTLPSDFKGESYIIAEGALKNKKAITSITLSDGVTAIADSAFAGCEALEELAISATVERIGKGITAGCNALAIITVDEENPTFDSREGCNAVISNTEYIASGDTTWVPTATPEAGKTYILECPLFYNLQGVHKALYNNQGSNVAWKTLDETDESFLWRVEATALGNVLKSVKDGRYLVGGSWSMGDSPNGCEFTLVPLEGDQVSVSIAGGHLHAANHGGGYGEEGTIVSWVTNSANSASAWVFTERKIDDVSQLPNTLVLGCKTTVIPESVVVIGDAAFSGVEALQTITIPASVTIIGREAFKGCSNLGQIHVKATTPATIYSNTFADYSATLYVPVGTLSDYQAADYWKNFFNVATDDETLIERVNSEETDDVIYDLMGRRVAEPQKGGIYIVNGRKVVIK